MVYIYKYSKYVYYRSRGINCNHFLIMPFEKNIPSCILSHKFWMGWIASPSRK